MRETIMLLQGLKSEGGNRRANNGETGVVCSDAALKGALAGHWAVWVNGNWRLTFTFEGPHASVVDYQDYH
jgi:hypothetical protein